MCYLIQTRLKQTAFVCYYLICGTKYIKIQGENQKNCVDNKSYDCYRLSMLTSLQDFDPVSYLEIDTSGMTSEEVDTLRFDLMSMIGEYVLIKFVNDLSPEEMDMVVDSKDKLFETLTELVPDLKKQIIQEIEQFKNEFYADLL